MDTLTPPNQRNLTLDLHIKTLSLKVDEHTPVSVVWSRGNKKAKTKSRLLNENVNIANIDEKFQINTVMEVDADGNPIKDKMSKLIIMGDKKGELGEANLNLREYSENEFKILRLPLLKCVDKDAYIEVGLRASPAKQKSNRNSSTLLDTTQESTGKDQLVQLLSDIEGLKKNNKKQKEEFETKVKNLKDQVNTLQTSLENTKTDLAHQHRLKQQLSNDKELMEKEVELHKKKVAQREDSIQENNIVISELREQIKKRDEQIKEVKYDMEKKEQSLKNDMKQYELKTQQSTFDMRRFYDFERFDCDYLQDAILFSKAEQGSPQKPVGNLARKK